MKLYFEIIRLLINKYIKHYENGKAMRILCEHMGIAYIKLAQILATQNYNNLFTEEDRKLLSSICDNCNPIPFETIQKILKIEYNSNLDNLFIAIDSNPIGSASISQVHKAILKNGDVVAIKIKRKDIVNNIHKDIEQMRKIVNRFGRLFQFNNFIGKDRALDLYIKWIYEETDFEHEKGNIKLYQEFANNVNGQVSKTKNIKVPKIYEELCTENIIVMEYIDYKTINKLELNETNKEKITTAINSYLKLSFNALLSDKPIIFHGDPHGGNIYIDKDGNIGFLDMGLLFKLSKDNAEMVKQLFLNAYLGNYDKLLELLMPYAQINDNEQEKFKQDIKKYCLEVKTKDITCYFTDVINICIKYEFLPPDFLFYMAKSLICLNGINKFSNNQISGQELLKDQAIEFFINRSCKDCKNLIVHSVKVAPIILKRVFQNGIANGLTEEANNIEMLHSNLTMTLNNFREMLTLFEQAYFNAEESKGSKTKKL